MYCSKCGNQVEHDNNFCSECGYPVPAHTNVEKAAQEMEGAVITQHQGLPVERTEKHPNYFIRHWRGDLTLGVSFWVNIFLLNAILSLLILPFQLPSIAQDINELFGVRGSFIFALGFEATVLAIWVWQVVGTWRCASRRMSEGIRVGPGIVKFLIVIGTIGTVARVGNSLGLYGALFEHSIQDLYGSYDLSVQGDKMYLNGQFSSGVSESVRDSLRIHQGIQYLVLDSKGGYIFEGQKLASIVKENTLMVHISDQCLSSCLLVLAEGYRRTASPLSRIGIHQATDILKEEANSEEVFRPVLARGFPRSDFNRGMATKHDDMWLVNLDALVGSGFLDDVIELSGPRTASSLTPNTRLERKKIFNDALSKQPMYLALKKVYPDVYDRVLNRMISEIAEYTSLETAFEKGIKIGEEEMAPLLPTVVPMAGDQEVIEFVSAFIEILKKLDKPLCYSYGFGVENTSKTNALRDLPTSFTARLNNSFEKLILSSAEAIPRSVATESELEPVWLSMDEDLLMAFVLYDKSRSLSNDEKATLCDAAIALYNGALRLAPTEAASVLRFLFAS